MSISVREIITLKEFKAFKLIAGESGLDNQVSSIGILDYEYVLQDGDIIESHYAVTRRNRTIHKRMREYLYELTHNEQLTTAVLPVGDGVTVSVKKEQLEKE